MEQYFEDELETACPICDAPMREDFSVCAKCYKEFNLAGIAYRNWPKWIKALVKIEAHNRDIDEHIITVPLSEEML